jgi:hypothetical protein
MRAHTLTRSHAHDAHTLTQGYEKLRKGLPDLAIDAARAARAYIQVRLTYLI